MSSKKKEYRYSKKNSDGELDYMEIFENGTEVGSIPSGFVKTKEFVTTNVYQEPTEFVLVKQEIGGDECYETEYSKRCKVNKAKETNSSYDDEYYEYSPSNKKTISSNKGSSVKKEKKNYYSSYYRDIKTPQPQLFKKTNKVSNENYKYKEIKDIKKQNPKRESVTIHNYYGDVSGQALTKKLETTTIESSKSYKNISNNNHSKYISNYCKKQNNNYTGNNSNSFSNNYSGKYSNNYSYRKDYSYNKEYDDKRKSKYHTSFSHDDDRCSCKNTKKIITTTTTTTNNNYKNKYIKKKDTRPKIMPIIDQVISLKNKQKEYERFSKNLSHYQNTGIDYESTKYQTKIKNEKKIPKPSTYSNYKKTTTTETSTKITKNTNAPFKKTNGRSYSVGSIKQQRTETINYKAKMEKGLEENEEYEETKGTVDNFRNEATDIENVNNGRIEKHSETYLSQDGEYLISATNCHKVYNETKRKKEVTEKKKEVKEEEVKEVLEKNLPERNFEEIVNTKKTIQRRLGDNYKYYESKCLKKPNKNSYTQHMRRGPPRNQIGSEEIETTEVRKFLARPSMVRQEGGDTIQTEVIDEGIDENAEYYY